MKNLNHTYKALLVALTALGATTALAAPATIPNTFSSGTAAIAAEVNDNFTALKSAIDDNDSRINTPIGGFVSVSSQAFRNERSDDCIWGATTFGSYGFYDSGSPTNCDPVAGIQLPHNASITSLTCRLYDNTLSNNMQARLYRMDLSTGSFSAIYTTPSTTESADIQILSDSTATSPGDEIVDNENYTYSLLINFQAGTDTSGTNLRVHNCTVAY